MDDFGDDRANAREIRASVAGRKDAAEKLAKDCKSRDLLNVHVCEISRLS